MRHDLGRIDVLGQERVDPGAVGQAGEEARHQPRHELAQLQVDGRELGVGGQVVARRHQEILLTQHGAHGVELGRPDVLDAVPHPRGGQPPLRQTLVEGGVNSRVKEQTPVIDQRLVAAQGGQLVGLGPHQQHDRFGQLPRRGNAQLVAGGQAQQGVAADDVGLDVRHPQAEADEAPVGLDNTAEDARRGQTDGGIDGQ
jgi:hypothetical protein